MFSHKSSLKNTLTYKKEKCFSAMLYVNGAEFLVELQ